MGPSLFKIGPRAFRLNAWTDSAHPKGIEPDCFLIPFTHFTTLSFSASPKGVPKSSGSGLLFVF